MVAHEIGHTLSDALGTGLGGFDHEKLVTPLTGLYVGALMGGIGDQSRLAVPFTVPDTRYY